VSANQKTKQWRDVCAKSKTLVTFIDLAGHEAYLKTTIAGLTGTYPDYAIVVVNSLAGISKMTKEHLGIVLALELPLIIVVTKIDLCPANVFERTKAQLFKVLRSPAAGSKLPVHVRNDDDVKMVVEKIDSGRVCPLVCVMCHWARFQHSGVFAFANTASSFPNLEKACSFKLINFRRKRSG